jgi:hypothetical protein
MELRDSGIAGALDFWILPYVFIPIFSILMRSYTISLLAFAAILFPALVGINWITDPYDIWDSGRLTGIRRNAPGVVSHYSPIAQIHRAFSSPLHAAIIGTSRAQAGLDPGHPGFGPGRGFNLATGGQPVEESAFIVQRLATDSSVKRIVWGLDFIAFNFSSSYRRDYGKEHFALSKDLSMLISLHTVETSIRTILNQGQYVATRAWFTADGRVILGSNVLVEENGHHAMAKQTELAYMRTFYLPLLSLDRLRKDRTGPLEYYRTILRVAHHRRIDLHLFISPSHARMWEALEASGGWPLWEEWKTQLVQINQEEAQKAGAMPFALWDFSGYNSLTTEPMPSKEDVETEMRWYWESSHYKKELGDLVLDRIFDYRHPDRYVPDDFGVRLLPENLKAHLKRIRSDREIWLSRHPDDAAEIHAAAQRLKRIGLARTFPQKPDRTAAGH